MNKYINQEVLEKKILRIEHNYMIAYTKITEYLYRIDRLKTEIGALTAQKKELEVEKEIDKVQDLLHDEEEKLKEYEAVLENLYSLRA